MLRNKFGVKKREAQKLYYGYRSTGKKEGGEKSPGWLESYVNNCLEDKACHIMTTLNETENKIDRIERDIDSIKDHVDQILKKT